MALSGASLMSALQKAHPRRVLLISDYGAHVDENIGMPSVFREIEAQLRALGGHSLALRSAEHMHNWGSSLSAALETGVLPSFQDPVDRPQPMSSAEDLGRMAADLLCRTGAAGEVVHAEGPQRYSARDVAAAMSELSGRVIRAQPVPREQWAARLGKAVPPSLADLLIRANDAKNKGGLVDVEPGSDAVLYGTTKLIDALGPLLPPN